MLRSFEVFRYFFAQFICAQEVDTVAHSESRSTLVLLVSCSSTCRIWPCDSYGSCHIMQSCSDRKRRKIQYFIFFFIIQPYLTIDFALRSLFGDHGVLWFLCDVLVHDRWLWGFSSHEDWRRVTRFRKGRIVSDRLIKHQWKNLYLPDSKYSTPTSKKKTKTVLLNYCLIAYF